MKKQLTVFLLLLCLLFSPVVCFAADATNTHCTDAPTPVPADGNHLLWSKRFGTSYKNAPSALTVVGNTVAVMSGNILYKLDGNTGEIIQQTEMTDVPCFSTVPALYADGKLFCPLDNGTIQAFDYATMQSLWIYKDSLGGQSLCPIVYADGYIYTGFWNDEDEDANFVCIAVSDADETKKATWTYTHCGGFYWTECVCTEEYVIVGSDNGSFDSDDASTVFCFRKETGEVTDSVRVVGDQRSGITLYNNRIFFVTKAGYLYGIDITNGRFHSLQVIALGGASTSTPVLYNGRMYVGVQGKTIKEGFLKVIDAKKMSVIYTASTDGYPQNAVLVSNAYEAKTGKIYIYTTYNAPPGGITVLTDAPGQTSAQVAQLFTPQTEQAAYCISNIVCSENGTLFYKNDSGFIFAIGKPFTADSKVITLFFDTLLNYLFTIIRSIYGVRF